MTESHSPAGDTEGVVVAVRPPPSNRTRRMSWWLVPVALSVAFWVARRIAGDPTGEITKLVLGTTGLAAWFLGFAVWNDRLSRRSELAVLTYGRVRARRGNRQRVITIAPGGGFRLTLDPVSSFTAAASSPRSAVSIPGVITREDATRLTDALHDTVPHIAIETVILYPSRPWVSIPQRRRNRRFARLDREVRPVIEDLIDTGHLRAGRVTFSAVDYVIEVGVDGDVAAIRALLAERVPMDHIRVYDATRK